MHLISFVNRHNENSRMRTHITDFFLMCSRRSQALCSVLVLSQQHMATLSLVVNLQCHYFKCPVAQITKLVCGPKQTTNLATHSENAASKT